MAYELTGWSQGAVAPRLDSVAAYARHVNAIAMLTPEREMLLAKDLRASGSMEAAKEMVLSHLRLVVKIAREHGGYGLAQEDLIQQGNVGLMLAVKKFDPDQGARLASYAAIWIKSEIQEYILSNWRVVKIGAAKGLRKLFFNLRKLQERLHGSSRLAQRDSIAELLGVERDEVDRAMQWFAGGDSPLLEEDSGEEGGGGGPARISLPSPASAEPDWQAHEADARRRFPAQLARAVEGLPPRESRVLQARYLQDGPPLTLAELGRELGVSPERVRQIESAALRRVRESSPQLRDWL